MAVTVTVAIGYALDAPVAVVLRLKLETLTAGLVQFVGLPGGEAKPGRVAVWVQMIVLALVSAPDDVVSFVAAYSAASRVAPSSVIQPW